MNDDHDYLSPPMTLEEAEARDRALDTRVEDLTHVVAYLEADELP